MSKLSDYIVIQCRNKESHSNGEIFNTTTEALEALGWSQGENQCWFEQDGEPFTTFEALGISQIVPIHIDDARKYQEKVQPISDCL